MHQVSRRRFRVSGVVQGVGFRPFVYGLATRRGLGGFVLNDGGGVVAEVEGEDGALEAFAEGLRTEAPPLARVETVVAEPLRAAGRAVLPHRREPAHGRRGADPAGRRHLRGVRARAVRPGRPALPLPVRELHPVRPALHDRPLGPLRPAEHDDGRLPALRGLPPRVRGPARPALPCRAELLCRLRAAADDAARGGGGAAARRADPRGQGARRLPPRLRRGRRGRGRPAARTQAPRGEAVRDPDGRARSRWRRSRRPSSSCCARRRGRSCSCAGARAP